MTNPMTEYDRGRAAGLAEAVKAAENRRSMYHAIQSRGAINALIEDLRALSTSPGEHVLVSVEWVRRVAGLHLRDVNGGRENFVSSGHDVAPLVHEARAKE